MQTYGDYNLELDTISNLIPNIHVKLSPRNFEGFFYDSKKIGLKLAQDFSYQKNTTCYKD